MFALASATLDEHLRVLSSTDSEVAGLVGRCASRRVGPGRKDHCRDDGFERRCQPSRM